MKVKAEVSASAMKMADGKSCPMMDKASKAMHTEAKHETAAGEAKSCDCSCCGHDKEDKVVASK